MISKLISKLVRQDAAIDIETLSKKTTYPILDARELIHVLDLNNRLRSIYRLSSVDGLTYHHLYQPAIDNFLVACQLQPASATHHHAGLGGLIVHTLEVVEYALKIRKKYLLPLNSEPEVQSREEHVWTYSIFAAALLHDAGKLLTLTRLQLDIKDPDQKAWTPLGPKLKDIGCDNYKIEFIRSPYDIQTRASAFLFDILPPKSRNMLVVKELIFKQLTAYLSGDKDEMGVIGEIVGTADRHSTGANISQDKTQSRLANAPIDSMGDMLISALKTCINEPSFKININGGSGWYNGQYLYIVSNNAANLAGNKLREDGATDVPNNSGIFDNFQNAGFALPNSKGLSVHKIKITSPANENKPFSHIFTVLKFEADRVIHSEKPAEPFAGTIIEVTDGYDKKTNNDVVETEITEDHNAGTTNTEQPPEPTNKIVDAETTVEAKETEQLDEPKNSTSINSDSPFLSKSINKNKPAHKKPKNKGKNKGKNKNNESKGDAPPTSDNANEEHTAAPTMDETLAATNSVIDLLTGTTDEPIDLVEDTIEEEQLSLDIADADDAIDEVFDHQNEPSVAQRKHDDELNRISQQVQEKLSGGAHRPGGKIYSEACTLDSDDVGRYFMTWLIDGIKTGARTINREDSKVHILKEGVAVVSPMIFKLFVRQQNLVASDASNETVNAAGKRVQERVRKLRVLVMTKKGFAAHKLNVANSEKHLHVFIIKQEFVYPNGIAHMPKVNPSLSLVIHQYV